MTDAPMSPGEILHRARQAAGEQRPRPWPPEDWKDRGPALQAVDEAMAAAVEAAVRERVAADFRRLADDLERFPLVPPGVPGIERVAKLEAWRGAEHVALFGLAPQERDDEKEPQL